MPDDSDKKEISPAMIWMLLLVGGGGVGGVSGFLSGGASSAVDGHEAIHAEHKEIWSEIRRIKDQISEIKAEQKIILQTEVGL